MSTSTPALVADIGGTNARFATYTANRTLEHIEVLAVDAFTTLEAAIAAYIERLGTAAPALTPRAISLAVATPVTGDEVEFTNSPWSFSCRDLRARVDLGPLVVVNDFCAQALALPGLDPAHRHQVGPGSPRAGYPLGVLGAGTGLGVGALVPTPSGWVCLPSEGGHVTLAGRDTEERSIIAALAERYGHVSAERVLSGAGLEALHAALIGDRDTSGPPLTAPAITKLGLSGEDPRCREVLERFAGFLGSVAGDLALTLGARGGIYVGGGIAPRLLPWLLGSTLRQRFEAKGRFRGFLRDIPTYVIDEPHIGLRGAGQALEASTAAHIVRID